MCGGIYEYWIKDVLSAYFMKIPYNLTTKHQQEERLFYSAWHEIMRRCFQSKQHYQQKQLLQSSIPLPSELAWSHSSSRHTSQIWSSAQLGSSNNKSWNDTWASYNMTLSPGPSAIDTYDTNTQEHQISIQKQRLREDFLVSKLPGKGYSAEWLSDTYWPFTRI